MKSSFQSNNSSSKKNKFNKNNEHSYSSSCNPILIMNDHGGASLSSPSAGQQSSGNGVDLDAAGSQDNDPASDDIFYKNNLNIDEKNFKSIEESTSSSPKKKNENFSSSAALKKLDTIINEKSIDTKKKNLFNKKLINSNSASCFINENYKNDTSESSSMTNKDRTTFKDDEKLQTNSLSASSSNASTSNSDGGSSFSSSSNESEDEDENEVDDDGNDCHRRSDFININDDINNKVESNIGNNNDEPNEIKNKSKPLNERLKFMEKFDRDYDGQVEKIADQATSIISVGSFYDCGLYQIISFLFISIAWTVGNGWYAYVSVFSGYTPEHECDVNAMSKGSMWNFTFDENDKKCSAINVTSNETVKCTKWKYDTSQMKATIVTEYDFVCDKDYYFEVAYSIEQIGYVIGTLVFSFIADVIGRKPVLVGVLIAMSIFGLIQQYVYNFYAYIALGFLINALACGSEAVCVTLVLEMFSTAKRTFFGIGIEVVWVIVLASMSPLAYWIKTWRELRMVIFVVLSSLALTSYWWCQESIRWLISMSKIKKTYLVIDRIIKYNRLDKDRSEKFAIKFQKRKNRLNKLMSELEKYNEYCEKAEIQNEKKSNQNSTLDLKIIVDEASKNNSHNILIENSVPVGMKNESSEVNLAIINPQPSSVSIVSKRSNDKIIDIIKNPKFRVYALIMSLNWFATALVYDGLTYLNNYIGENIFINWISMNLIELPAQFVCYLVISRYGRRLTTSVTLILAGLILLASMIEMIEIFEKALWLKLAIFVLAKFIVTQAYSSVILHAPELFPTNLRSFGYGICLFSSKVTSVFSPMISIYLSKIMPRLPASIYGIISITCGIVSLYVPETLNRPLPNSIDDIVKWPRSLSKKEKKTVRELNKKEMNTIVGQLITCFKPKCRRGEKDDGKLKCKINRIHKTKTLSTIKTQSTLLNNSTLEKSNEHNLAEQKLINSYFVEENNLSKSSSASSSLLFLNKKNSTVININKNINNYKLSEFQSLSSSSSSNSNSSSESSGDCQKQNEKTQKNKILNKQKSTSLSYLSSTPLNNSAEIIAESKFNSMPRLKEANESKRNINEYGKNVSIELNLTQMKNSN